MKVNVYSDANLVPLDTLKPGQWFYLHKYQTARAGMVISQTEHDIANGFVSYLEPVEGDTYRLTGDTKVIVGTNLSKVVGITNHKGTGEELLVDKAVVFSFPDKLEELYIAPSDNWYKDSTNLITGKKIDTPDPDTELLIWDDVTLHLCLSSSVSKLQETVEY